MNYNNIRQVLRKIKKAKLKILVLGDSMLDEYITGNVKRISPEAPVPILDFDGINSVLGGAGNVAHNLININSEVSIATILGKDFVGKEIESLFKISNISNKFIIKSKSANSTKKTRFLSKSAQLMRLDNDSAGFSNQDFINLEKLIIPALNEFNSIIISDYDKGVCKDNVVENMIKKAKGKNIPIYIDPKGSNWSKYHNATCLTPNKEEAESELKLKLEDDIDFEKAGKAMIKKYNLDSCLITRGSKGMTYVDKNNFIHQSVSKKEVFDVSGAGDTVISSFAASMSAKLSINEALNFSSSISSEVVTYIGTTPYKMEMTEQ
jgi:rfaE bifunctional protein kinase chain/domain